MSQDIRARLDAYAATRRCLLVHLEQLRTAKQLAERVCSTAPDTAPDLAPRLKDLTDRCTETASDLYYCMEEAQCLIHRLSVPLLREILERRYLQEETFRQIAAATHYSEGHIRRLHRAALAELAAKSNPPVSSSAS
ncbi:MAG: hypothetical protein J6S41_02915 [Clostridia bacterium]|nr:hypothetical protein [Clostridia bacterium]